jgi:FkbM family methyltransferase
MRVLSRLEIRLAAAELMRPLVCWMPRGSARAYRMLLGPVGSTFHGDAPVREVLRDRRRVFYDRHIDAYVEVDLADWAQRWHYFRGVYYDKFVPLLISQFLPCGGTFLDIGANRGIHTLYACRTLGRAGRVYAFEPNPRTCRVLESHLSMNLIENCEVFNVGLGDEPGELPLNLFEDRHSGTCSFVATAPVMQKCIVPVRTLDSMADCLNLTKPILAKIDTEGYELKVLRGMGSILVQENVVVICEVTDPWLRKLGSSACELFAMMADHGFKAYRPETHFAGLISEKLLLRPCPQPPDEFSVDVVFAKEGVLRPPLLS